MENVRRVLSFDVGIVNLAYCILEIDDKEKRFKIDGWGIINLADGRKTCSFIKNTGELCDKVATNVLNVNKDNKQYFCKAHASKASLCVKPVHVRTWEVPSDEIETCIYCKKSGQYYCNKIEGQFCGVHLKKALSDKKMICVTKKCGQPISFGLFLEKPASDDDDAEHFYEFEHGWCNKHFDDDYATYIKKKTKKLPQNSNKISLYNIGASMYKKLDSMPNLLRVDEVLVENQPTFINPTMKSVSAMLFSYFVMRGIHEKSTTKSTIRSINFCSPSNKIKVGGEDADKRLENAKEDKVYKVTKELGKRFCKALMDDHPEWLELIEKHKKQDDMADAFLQGFIMNFGPTLPEFYAEKIRRVDTNIFQKDEYEVDYEIKCKAPQDIKTELLDGTVIASTDSDKGKKNREDVVVDNDEDDGTTIKIGRIKAVSGKKSNVNVYDPEKRKYYNKNNTAKTKKSGTGVKRVVRAGAKK